MQTTPTVIIAASDRAGPDHPTVWPQSVRPQSARRHTRPHTHTHLFTLESEKINRRPGHGPPRARIYQSTTRTPFEGRVREKKKHTSPSSLEYLPSFTSLYFTTTLSKVRPPIKASRLPHPQSLIGQPDPAVYLNSSIATLISGLFFLFLHTHNIIIHISHSLFLINNNPPKDIVHHRKSTPIPSRLICLSLFPLLPPSINLPSHPSPSNMSSAYYSPQPAAAPSAFGFLHQDDDLLHSLYSPSAANALYGPPTPPLSASGSSMEMPSGSSLDIASAGLYSSFPSGPTSYSQSPAVAAYSVSSFAAGYSPSSSFAPADYNSPTASCASVSASVYANQPYGPGPTSYSNFWNTPPSSSELPHLSFSPVADQHGAYTYAARPPSSSSSAYTANFLSDLPSSTLHSSSSSSIQLSPVINKHLTRPAGSTQTTSSQASAVSRVAVAARSMYSRSITPTSAADLYPYGFPNGQGSWSCGYPGCTSKAVFIRGCDLRKHYKRHTKTFFCQHQGCPQSRGGGFSSRKDLARHEAKHNPAVRCDWPGCERIFSRVDNMRDHVKRIHHKAAQRDHSARQATSKATALTESTLPGVVSGNDTKQPTSISRSYSPVDSKSDYRSAVGRVALPSVTLPSLASSQSGSGLQSVPSLKSSSLSSYSSRFHDSHDQSTSSLSHPHSSSSSTQPLGMFPSAHTLVA